MQSRPRRSGLRGAGEVIHSKVSMLDRVRLQFFDNLGVPELYGAAPAEPWISALRCGRRFHFLGSRLDNESLEAEVRC